MTVKSLEEEKFVCCYSDETGEICAPESTSKATSIGIFS